MDTTTHTLEGKKRNGEHILINMTYVAKNIDLDSGIELTRAFEYWRRYFEENNIVSALVISAKVISFKVFKGQGLLSILP